MNVSLNAARAATGVLAAMLIAGGGVCGCASEHGGGGASVVWYVAGAAAGEGEGNGVDAAARSGEGRFGPRVAAMGNLAVVKQPSATRQKLAEFFFGEPIEIGPGLVKPGAICATGDGLVLFDAGLGALVRWHTRKQRLDEAVAGDGPAVVSAVFACVGGDVLVALPKAGVVMRYGSGGRETRRYQISTEMRPMGVAQIGDEVWCTNAARHAVEVFDAASGSHRRTIGRAGDGPGEFNTPMGLASRPGGGAAVVDMFNARVQLFDGRGELAGQIGGPGDGVGQFGRPRDVAIGPDGTIFVLDAALQRVHAFDESGRALMAFGRRADDDYSLMVPAGLCISTAPPTPRAGAARYFVLVSEQLFRPGVRVYGWHGDGGSAAADARGAR